MIEPAKRYRTNHLAVAAYAHATRSLELVGTEMLGSTVNFIFDATPESGQQIEQAFFDGGLVRAVDFLHSQKVLRNAIDQQRNISNKFHGAPNTYARPTQSRA